MCARWLPALCLTCGIVASASPALATRLLFVSNTADDTVSVIDCDLDREVEILKVGNAPQGLALRAHEPLLAVANTKARYASLIDPVRLETLPESLPTGMGPEDVAFTAGGAVLAATSYYDKTVTFTEVSARRPVGAPLAFDVTPRRLATSPDGRELYVLLHDQQGAVAIVDPAAHTVLATIPVGPFPTGMAVSADGRTLLAASFDATTITVIDVPSRSVTDTFSVDTGADIVLHPTKPIVYSMLNFDGAVQVADYAARRSLATIEIGGSPVAGVATPDGRFLYAVNSEGSNATKIDLETNTPVVRIAVGAEPAAAVLFERGGAIPWPWLGAAAALIAAVVAAVAWRRRRQGVAASP